MAERTGCPVVLSLWSYVPVNDSKLVKYQAHFKNFEAHARERGLGRRGGQDGSWRVPGISHSGSASRNLYFLMLGYRNTNHRAGHGHNTEILLPRIDFSAV